MKFNVKKALVDPNKHAGHWILCTCCGQHEPMRIKVEKVVGSMIKPTRFEVTSEGTQHWVVILDFFAQVHKDKNITPEMIHEFDQMEFYVVPPADKTGSSYV